MIFLTKLTNLGQKLKLSIGQKIILGYVPLLLLIFGLSLYTLYRLKQVNRINRQIIGLDLVLNEVSSDLMESLKKQSSYGQAYHVIRRQSMLLLFWEKDRDFMSSLAKLNALNFKGAKATIKSLSQNHTEFNKYFQSTLESLDSTSTASFQMSDSLGKIAMENQMVILRELIEDSRENQIQNTETTGRIIRGTFRTVTVWSIIGLLVIASIAFFITSNILSSIKTLKSAIALIAQGIFTKVPLVKSRDELGDLSLAFNDMASRLLKLEELYMDSSPLTRLPGGIAIENSVKICIEHKEPFAFCMMDLDNFKPFNDRYGYSRGNAVIKHTAKILLECSRDHGNQNDFTGHIGGDDFALITVPEKYEIICNKVIQRFDEEIIKFYNKEDIEKGYILSKNRQGESLTFPIMTISIGVLDSVKSPVDNYIQVGEVIAELKKFAKTFKESKMVLDRRGSRRVEDIGTKAAKPYKVEDEEKVEE